MKTQAYPLTRQYKGESSPRSLYRCFRSGGNDRLESYAFSVRQAFCQAGFNLSHQIIYEDENMIYSKAKNQMYLTVKVDSAMKTDVNWFALARMPKLIK